MIYPLILITISALYLPFSYSLLYDFLLKFKLPNSDSNNFLDCSPMNNKYYTIWLCDDVVAFISNQHFKDKNSDDLIIDKEIDEPTIFLFHGKISQIIYLEDETFLLIPNEHRIVVIVNDNEDKFEKYYIDLVGLPFHKNLDYLKISAVKNGDFITFSLWINENSTGFDYIVMFNVPNKYPVVKKDKNLMVYEKQILYMSSITNLFLRKNEVSGYLNLFVSTKEGHVDIYETGFENLDFSLTKSLNFRRESFNEAYEILFYEKLIIVNDDVNSLMIYKMDSSNNLTKVCDIPIDGISVSNITLIKRPMVYYHSHEYLLGFINEITSTLFLYRLISFDHFYFSSSCKQLLSFTDVKLLNMQSIEILQINTQATNSTTSQTFRYISIRSPFFDSLNRISLIPLCFSNEFLTPEKTCSLCPSSNHSTSFQDLYCFNSCVFQPPSNPLDLIYCPPSNECAQTLTPFLSTPINFTQYKWSSNIDSNNSTTLCELECQTQSLSLKNDQCLTVSEVLLYEDYCTKFTDCYNCSIAYDCSWCRNGCNNMASNSSSDCDTYIYERFSDNLWKFDRCERMSFCGEHLVYLEPEGSITFNFDNNETINYIPKNSFCSWEIFTYKSLTSDYVFYNLYLASENGFMVDSNAVSPKMSFCLFAKQNTECFSWPMDLNFTNFSLSYRVYFKRFKILIHFPEELQVNAGKFEIIFQRQQEFLMDFTTLFGQWIFISVLSVFFMACCILLLRSVSISLRRDRNIPLLRRLEFELYNFETPKNRLKRLLREKIINKESFDGNTRYDQVDCPFCLDKFEIGSELARCCCKHIFHYSCMEQWNRVEKRTILQCPLCKEDLIKRLDTSNSTI